VDTRLDAQSYVAHLIRNQFSFLACCRLNGRSRILPARLWKKVNSHINAVVSRIQIVLNTDRVSNASLRIVYEAKEAAAFGMVLVSDAGTIFTFHD